jgi:predicted RecB family nuclease
VLIFVVMSPHTLPTAKHQTTTMIYRRHLTAKAIEAAQQGNTALASAWRSKAKSQSGVPLPVNIAVRDKLIELGIDTFEDLEGATVEGIINSTCFSSSTAKKLLEQISEAQIARGTNNKTVLPVDFPAKDALIAFGYTTLESLAGHDEKLLVLIPNVSSDDAKNIVKKLKELLTA